MRVQTLEISTAQTFCHYRCKSGHQLAPLESKTQFGHLTPRDGVIYTMPAQALLLRNPSPAHCANARTHNFSTTLGLD